MKRTVLLWLLMAASVGAWAQHAPFLIKGQLKNADYDNYTVMLSYLAGGKRVTDSVKIVHGKYRFKGTVEESVSAIVIGLFPGYDQGRSDIAANLFIEPGIISVVHGNSFSDAVVSGTSANIELAELQQKLEPQTTAFKVMAAAYRTKVLAKETAGTDQLRVQLEEADSLIKESYLAYVKQHPSSTIAMYAVQKYLPYQFDVDKAEPVYNILGAAIRQTAAAKELKTRIDFARLTGVGKMAPDFTQNDTLDQPVSLSSFRGRYVLIDFWASWCGPCRAENPAVVKAYHTYKNKGFTVLGISLDNAGTKDKWLKAIHDDGLTWTQVSDLKGWANAAAKAYGIQAIPQNFLVDPKGKIVGKNLRGEALDKKLAELL